MSRFVVGDRVTCPGDRPATVVQVDSWNPGSKRPRPRVVVQLDGGGTVQRQFSPGRLKRLKD